MSVQFCWYCQKALSDEQSSPSSLRLPSISPFLFPWKNDDLAKKRKPNNDLKPTRTHKIQLRTRDPATGLPISAEEIAAVPENVTPVNVQTKGNYAVSISWSDGHRGGIYSYEVLRKVAEAVAVGGLG